MPNKRCVHWFEDIRLKDIPQVGGKTASLGELCALLVAGSGRVPDGFALIADAYREARTAAGAWGELRHLLADLDHHNVVLLAETMPQITLTPDETEDIVGYIISLRTHH